MLNLKSYLESRQELIESELSRMFQAAGSARIVKAMQYSLMAGGKRVRPVLCLAAAAAVGGAEATALPAACALEMVHTYSLIHDDLPVMDDDRLRRGKPTCHIQFDEATAVMAGDGLLTLAFETLAKAGMASGDDNIKWMQVIQLMATAAGFRGMIEGQMQDMAAEGVHLTAAELETMHSLKTGALIQASLAIGALLGNGTDQQQHDLKLYGRKIGLAFQVADDLLNVNGNPDHMGKAVGTDQIRGKNTYPALLGLAASERLAENLIEQALQAVAFFDSKADPLRLIARYIIDRNR